MDTSNVATGTQAMFLLTAPRDYASSGSVTVTGLITSNDLSSTGLVVHEVARATYG